MLSERTSTLCGWTDFRHHIIGLDVNQAPSGLRDTLLHEILHACLVQNGMHNELT